VSKHVTVAGAGYVGLAMSVLIAQRYHVLCCDISEERIALLKNGLSPIEDPDISKFLATRELNLRFTTESRDAYSDADIVVVATPTDYDVRTGKFDTTSVSQVVDEAIRRSTTSTIVIKSTTPVGYTESLRSQYSTDRIIFCPEFLREGRALADNLYPSRIVVGGNDSSRSTEFGEMMQHLALREDVPVLYLSNSEAEAVKLFSNTYLAMRVAFFNELDSFAIDRKLNARSLVDAVCLDPRIGDGYNNPSFGYGGYCLPKDTKQLLGNYSNIPQAIIGAVVEANNHRMDFVASDILSKSPRTVGIYKLSMKADSDNFRESSILGVIARLVDRGVNLIVYEPSIDGASYQGIPVVNDREKFAESVDLIVTNRLSPDLMEYREKVYTRDLFGVN
jgi:UDPglucose 6-dehydrogenase